MKILMVTNTYLPIVGGLEKSVRAFSEQFRQWGHEVKIVSPGFEGAATNDPSIIWIPALQNVYGTDFSVNLPVSPAIFKKIHDFQPDIIHAHHPFLLGEMALRLAVNYRKPLIYTHHIYFDEYASYLPIPIPMGKRFLTELSVGFANLSSRVIAPSPSMKSVLTQDGVTRPIDIVPTGVNISVFSNGNGEAMRQRLGIPKQAFVAGYIGRLAAEKNLKFLVKAVMLFLKAEPRAHFLFAGRGPLEEFMLQEFAGAGLAARTHFAGMVQAHDLVDCYHALDVFVFASKSETQGMVITEAMAAGVPVVALDAPGVRDIVRDKENGRLLSHEDEKAFQLALTECVQKDSREWQSLKQSARDTAKLFSLENCAEQALSVYRKAAADLLENAPNLHQKQWFKAAARFRTEWGIFANFGRATRKALAQMIALNSK